ncbi:MAG: hypothetical protein KF850_27985 [Labilithrix sp.]|nr:hypothetical protein [Labilithrix sp.]
MVQGFACHARGVELVASGTTRVHARVRSKRTHDVHLRAEGGRLLVACTCPARSFGLDACKHAWATLLEVDRQEALTALRGARGPLVVEAAPHRPAEAAPREVPPPAAVLDAAMTPAAPVEARAGSRRAKAIAAPASAERDAPTTSATTAPTKTRATRPQAKSSRPRPSTEAKPTRTLERSPSKGPTAKPAAARAGGQPEKRARTSPNARREARSRRHPGRG